MKALEIINLRQPGEVCEFRYGQLELLHIAGQLSGATRQPGWCWTQHVGLSGQTSRCENRVCALSRRQMPVGSNV